MISFYTRHGENPMSFRDSDYEVGKKWPVSDVHAGRDHHTSLALSQGVLLISPSELCLL